MATFDPGQAKFRVALANADGVPPFQTDGAWKDMDFLSEELSAEYPLKESESIRGLSQRRRGNPSKIAVGGSVQVELNTQFHYLYLAHLQRNSAAPVTSGTVSTHELAPRETANAFGALCLDIDRDDGYPHVFNDVWVNNWNLSLAIDEWVQSTFELVGSRADYWDDPEDDAGTGTAATSVRLRGLPKYSEFSGSNTDLEFQVDAADANVLKAEYSTGSATFAGSTTFTVVPGSWTRVVLTDGTDAGTEDLPVEIYVDSPTPLSLNDEFSFNLQRGTWTPSWASVPGTLDEIYITISVDGTEECIRGVDLTVEQPLFIQQCLGQRYPQSIRRSGLRSITGTINRDYLDVAFRKRLERAQDFTLRIEMKNGEVISGASNEEQYEIEVYCPKCVLSGTTKSITGAEDFEENLEFTAYNDPDEGSGDTDDMTIWLVTPDADLTD